MVLQSRLGITESNLVLQNRFLYYKVEFCITESIFVAQNSFWHYRVGLGITDWIFVFPKYFLIL